MLNEKAKEIKTTVKDANNTKRQVEKIHAEVKASDDVPADNNTDAVNESKKQEKDSMDTKDIAKERLTALNKKNNEKKTGKATTEKKKDKNKNKKTLESTESTLAYTDNSSMNVGACLSPEDYNTVTAKDDSFSFAYPKYLFNHSEVNEEGTSYTFSYKGNSVSNEAVLSVYTQENEGDPLQNARELYQNFSSEVYKKYFKMYPSRVDSSGMARTLIGASADSSEKTGVYIIAANDGKRDYILKFTYPDPDMTNDYNEIDYVVDCVYRLAVERISHGPTSSF